MPFVKCHNSAYVSKNKKNNAAASPMHSRGDSFCKKKSEITAIS